MNGRQFSFGTSGNPLAQLLGLVVFGIVAIGAVIMGTVVLLAFVGLAFVGFVALTVRGWWVQRKLRQQPGSGASRSSGQAQARRLIEAEYEVIETEDDERPPRERGQR